MVTGGAGGESIVSTGGDYDDGWIGRTAGQGRAEQDEAGQDSTRQVRSISAEMGSQIKVLQVLEGSTGFD